MMIFIACKPAMRTYSVREADTYAQYGGYCRRDTYHITNTNVRCIFLFPRQFVTGDDSKHRTYYVAFAFHSLRKRTPFTHI